MTIKIFCPETQEWMKSAHYQIGLIEDMENDLNLAWEEIHRLCTEKPSEYWSTYVVGHIGSILDCIIRLCLLGPDKSSNRVFWKHRNYPSKVKNKWKYHRKILNFINRDFRNRSKSCNKLYRWRNEASHNIAPLDEEPKLDDLIDVICFARAVHTFVKELIR